MTGHISSNPASLALPAQDGVTRAFHVLGSVQGGFSLTSSVSVFTQQVAKIEAMTPLSLGPSALNYMTSYRFRDSDDILKELRVKKLLMSVKKRMK